ncbi:MAG: hypothetical protein IKI84_12755 [Clostridia bacterium]|nr:hypothetical protein [Clostridia bacterium]
MGWNGAHLINETQGEEATGILDLHTDHTMTISTQLTLGDKAICAAAALKENPGSAFSIVGKVVMAFFGQNPGVGSTNASVKTLNNSYRQKIDQATNVLLKVDTSRMKAKIADYENIVVLSRVGRRFRIEFPTSGDANSFLKVYNKLE